MTDDVERREVRRTVVRNAGPGLGDIYNAVEADVLAHRDPIPEWVYILVSDLVRCYTLKGILRDIMESEDIPKPELTLVHRTVNDWTTRLQERLERVREKADR